MFVKSTIEFLDELIDLQKMWESSEVDSWRKDDGDSSDLDIIDDGEDMTDEKQKHKSPHLSSDEKKTQNSDEIHFDPDKLKELSTFVTECNPGISSDEKLASSSDEDGKYSDGEIEAQNSEEILESFVREINEERLHETEG